MGWVVTAVAVLGVTVLVFVVSHHTLRSAGRQSAGMGDAFGNFIDVFDPGRSRNDRELKSHDNQTEIAPSPDDDDDRPMRVIDSHGQRIVRIRQPRSDGS